MKRLARVFVLIGGTSIGAVGAIGGCLADPGSTGSEGIVLAESTLQPRPIRLGADPTQIPLGGQSLGDIGGIVRDRGATRVYLVLENVRAEQPPGVLFEVLLGIDSEPRSPADGRVGRFNLFESRRLLSFDVTERLEALVGSESRASKLFVTIRPAVAARSHGGAPGSMEKSLRVIMEQAVVSVGAVRLVAQ